MAKILSINGYDTGEKSSLFGLFKDWFSSQDRFVKNAFVVLLLLAVATPFIVTNRLSLLQHASPNGGVAFVSATNNTAITTTATPDVYLQLAYPDSWSLTDAQQPGFVKQAYAAQDSCDFANIHDGDSIDPSIANQEISVEGTRSNGSYYLAWYYGDHPAGGRREDGFTSGVNYASIMAILGIANQGILHLECRIQTEAFGGSTIFSKSIAVHMLPSPTSILTPTATIVPTVIPPTTTPRPTASVPTATPAVVPPSPTPSVSALPTETPGASPTTVPTHPVLFKITIQNADTTGAETRILTITGPQNIANALNSPVSWRINPLAQNETSAQRNVEVTYFAHTANGDTQVPVTANITLITPVVSPTPTPTGVLSPTPTPLGTYTTPTTSPEHPTPTGGGNPSPTVTTAPGVPTATPTSEVPPATPTLGQQRPTATPTSSVPPTVTETPAPVTGDANRNGCVDTNDFNIWAQAFQTQHVQQGTNPDFDHNGKIEINDASIWYQAVQKGDHNCPIH